MDYQTLITQEIQQYFDNDPYRYLIFLRTYSRWDENNKRRESWTEVVDRYMDFMKENLGEKLSKKDYSDVRSAILHQKVVPSMRLLWASGPAARKTNVTGYNCSFVAPTKLQDFGEILYLLTCGCGVGFTVESHVVSQLPIVEVQQQREESEIQTLMVADNREGWADALVTGMKAWFNGTDIKFDFSKIRPAGSRLKTMGGRASGPEPLIGLLEFTRSKILARQGSQLRPIDVHDIICKIGDIVIVGGVRRSAEISLSDLWDEEMRKAKSGAFYLNEPQRSMANNSVAYKTRPTQAEFMREWLELMESGSGERGIFNRAALLHQMPSRRVEGTGEMLGTMGTNPCGEITLRSKEFCNLSEVVARSEDTYATLREKIRIATIIGTYQSSLTHFPYLSREWKKNCDEERLLGVSITGQFDSKAARDPKIMAKLRDYAVEVNRKYAVKIGINPSVSVTCTKPSGTVSQLVNSASGIHPRYAKYYFRRIRINTIDPLFHLMRDQGVPNYEDRPGVSVLEFPIKAPKGAITRHDVTAISQLEYWKKVKQNFTEHNPSCTIYIGTNEWIAVANWLWDNWGIIGGLSFLPKEDENIVYRLAPYEEITEEQYEEAAAKMPKVNFSKIVDYEVDDSTQGAKELACVSGVCEVDIPADLREKMMEKMQASVA